MYSLFKTLIAFALVSSAISAAFCGTTNERRPPITILNPPEQDFFSKELFFHGIPIKAQQVVSDAAMYAAFGRLSLLLSNLPVVVTNLVAAKVELHLIGKEQVATDLPEWREDKGKPLPE